MQVAVGGLHRDLLTHQPAQSDADRRRVAIPHAGIADQREIGLEFAGIGLEERLQRRRTGFLLALEQDGDAARQIAMHLFPGAASLDEGHQLALVVGRPPTDDHLVVRPDLLDSRRERIAFPQFDRVDRLNVIMAVKQHMRRTGRAVMVRNHHRVAGRVANAGVEADQLEFGHQPFRRLAAVGGIGWIGGDGLDPEQAEQALEALVEILVETVEDGETADICEAFRFRTGTVKA